MEEYIELLPFMAVLLFLAFKILSHKPKRRYRSNRRQKPVAHTSDMSVPENQITAISKVAFQRTKLLNKPEYRILLALEECVRDMSAGHRVMAQVCLGEFIQTKRDSGDWRERKDAFASINSKRVDFAILNRNGFIDLVVEYQGSGHYQENAFKRDAVKREALRRAGVEYLEVKEGMLPSDVKRNTERLLSPSQTSNSSTNRAFS